MEIKLIASTNNIIDPKEMLDFGGSCAKICYNPGGWKDVKDKKVSEDLLKHLINCGHHSPFEHISLTFSLNISKALAMVLNNEKQYATSEQSARYTTMENIEAKEKKLYDKWINILLPEIDKVYPKMDNPKKRENLINEKAKENADI